jgi:hypothetical protein
MFAMPGHDHHLITTTIRFLQTAHDFWYSIYTYIGSLGLLSCIAAVKGPL